MALAGYIAERAAGKPFAELARSEVFEPLGMTHSSFGRVKRAAVPYEWTGGISRAAGGLSAGCSGRNDGVIGREYGALLDCLGTGASGVAAVAAAVHAELAAGGGDWLDLGVGAVARTRDVATMAAIRARWLGCGWFPAEGVGYFIAGNGLSGSGEVQCLADGVEWDARGGGGSGGGEEAVEGFERRFHAEVEGLVVEGEQEFGAGVVGHAPGLFGAAVERGSTGCRRRWA